MRICAEEWVSETADEAIVAVKDGNIEIFVYCHPYDYAVGDEVEMELHPVDVRAIRQTDENGAVISRHHDGLGYDLKVVVHDIDDGLAKLGEVVLVFDEPLPGDIRNGDRVEFSCSRIDLW